VVPDARIGMSSTKSVSGKWDQLTNFVSFHRPNFLRLNGPKTHSDASHSRHET
jgi:hypothetical protein